MAEYIERDKVLEAILDLPPKMDEQGYGWLGRMGVWQMLSDFPSADVAPVVKARWVYTNMSRLVCSNCGNPVAFSLKEDGWHHGDFCPNCGAIMDGET